MRGRRMKAKTKRVTLKMKYKIQKKVKEHGRKLKKEMKKNPGKYAGSQKHGKKSKDPGIPNSLPFKAEIISDAKKANLFEDERRKKLNEELKMRNKNEKINSNTNINDLAEKAKYDETTFESRKRKRKDRGEFTDKSAKTFYKEFKKVVDAADVVLEVLDARDPQGSRCSPMEEMVLSDPDKKLVLVLNKADLVPKANLEAWLKYLRREHPAILFKASTQNQARKLSHLNTKSQPLNDESFHTSKCVGADVLMQLLKNYCRNCGIKTAISVGVVGLPNVGKSSLINSLKRSKACNIGATAGVTKTLQEVTLDSKIRLLDCPGVILPGDDSSDAASVIRNALKIQALKNPIPPVEAILERAGKEHMRTHYDLDAFNDTMEFLALYAKKTGKTGKGGRPNVEVAARMVLRDWNVGKIKYYTTPPEVAESASTEVKSTLMSKMTEEFSLDEIDSTTEVEMMEDFPEVADSATVKVGPSKPLQTVFVKPEKEETTNNILPQNVEIDLQTETAMEEDVLPAKKARWETEPKEVDLSKVSLKKLQKEEAKKKRKEMNRNNVKTMDLVRTFEGLNGAVQQDSYDFNQYFDD